MLRLEVVASGDIDWALCALPEVRLERRDGGVFIECDAAIVDEARVLLARAGARTSTAAEPQRAAPLVPARLADLEPLDAAGAIDTVTVRVLSAGEAAHRPRRGLFRRLAEPDRVRAVLRGDDRAFAWRRIVWADRAALRSKALARARPIVFDRNALARGDERRGYARDRALARWIGR
jgi:hypothetical protein